MLPRMGPALPHLPFTAGSFDAVAANYVLNHVGDPRTGVAELVLVARPGACCLKRASDLSGQSGQGVDKGRP